MANKIKVGIFGGSGYTGEELTKLICSHSGASLCAISSRELEGKDLSSIYPDIPSLPDINFCSPKYSNFKDCEVVFFATPHGISMNFVKEFLANGTKVIDLSSDFRIMNPKIWEKWYGLEHTAVGLLNEAVYGLPEINKDKISTARLIAVPGCYPTATLLGILPVLESGKKIINITCDAKTGVSGAGRKAVDSYLLSEMKDNFRAYSVENHRHTTEIQQLIDSKSNSSVEFNFVPHHLPIMRGIYATLYVSIEDLNHNWPMAFEEYYNEFQSIAILGDKEVPESIFVNNTNKCHISIKNSSISNQLVIISAIDNLVKGASGQALQCFNLMHNFEIDYGLA